MSFLAVEAHVSPDVFAEMLHRDSKAMAKHVDKLVELRDEAALERTKALMAAMGAKFG